MCLDSTSRWASNSPDISQALWDHLLEETKNLGENGPHYDDHRGFLQPTKIPALIPALTDSLCNGILGNIFVTSISLDWIIRFNCNTSIFLQCRYVSWHSIYHPYEPYLDDYTNYCKHHLFSHPASGPKEFLQIFDDEAYPVRSSLATSFPRCARFWMIDLWPWMAWIFPP